MAPLLLLMQTFHWGNESTHKRIIARLGEGYSLPAAVLHWETTNLAPGTKFIGFKEPPAGSRNILTYATYATCATQLTYTNNIVEVWESQGDDGLRGSKHRRLLRSYEAVEDSLPDIPQTNDGKLLDLELWESILNWE